MSSANRKLPASLRGPTISLIGLDNLIVAAHRRFIHGGSTWGGGVRHGWVVDGWRSILAKEARRSDGTGMAAFGKPEGVGCLEENRGKYGHSPFNADTSREKNGGKI